MHTSGTTAPYGMAIVSAQNDIVTVAGFVSSKKTGNDVFFRVFFSMIFINNVH